MQPDRGTYMIRHVRIRLEQAVYSLFKIGLRIGVILVLVGCRRCIGGGCICGGSRLVRFNVGSSIAAGCIAGYRNVDQHVRCEVRHG